MPDIFLSYSHEDQPAARRLAGALERAGFSVWWDQTITAGEAYDRVTEKALEESRAVVVLWSKTSVESRWVRSEATQADRKGTLVPALIEPCKRPIMFELTQTADLSRWDGDPEDRAWQSFLAGVRRTMGVEPGASSAATPAPVLPADLASAPGRKRWRWAAIAAAAVLVAAVGLSWKWTGRDAKPAPAVDAAAPAETATEVTLAVLPFVNLSADPQQEYFSDGLTEEILNQLAQTRELRVTGRTSSFAFKGQNEDLRVIAGKLDVAHLLEGSVRREGVNLRVTAQLIEGASGAHQWSRTYDRKSTEIFAVQEEIAKDVAQALRVTLDVGETSRSRGGTTNVEAYEKYLQAGQLVRREGRGDFLQAAALLRDALDLDPRFASAWGLLDTALEGALERDPDDPAAVQKERETAQAKVLELAPTSRAAKELRILALLRARKYQEAEAAARGSGVMLDAVALLTGRTREGVRFFEREIRQDPLSLSTSTNLQILLRSAGQPERAGAEYERSKTLQGDHGRADHFAVLQLMNDGRTDPARVKAEFKAFLDEAPLPMKLDAELSEHLDDVQAARAAIRAAVDDPANQHPTRQLIISLYADAFGDKDTALVTLRRAVVGPVFYNLSASVMWYAYRTGLRADPRFKDILRDSGLAAYFRASGNWNDYCRPLGDDDFECR